MGLRKIYHFLTLLLFFLLAGKSFSQGTEKPFILEHILHKHIIHFSNTTVYQQIKGYGAVYNASHLFATIDITASDEVFLNASIAFGNGVTEYLEKDGFSLSTTADDLEDYLKDINDTGRKYLLEAYYQKTVDKMTVALGLIDSTAFIDTNKYANDENLQFLNDAFVNNPIAVLPSYNPGIYMNYQLKGNLSFSGVYITNDPDKGNVGIVEIDYEKDNLTVRPYYYYLFGTEENKGFGVSGDFNINEKTGLFFRGGYSTTEYKYFISGGCQISNLFFAKDKIGLGYGYIEGNDVKDINVFEGYYEISLLKRLYTSVDIQYIDEYKSRFVYGGRIYFSY